MIFFPIVHTLINLPFKPHYKKKKKREKKGKKVRKKYFIP